MRNTREKQSIEHWGMKNGLQKEHCSRLSSESGNKEEDWSDAKTINFLVLNLPFLVDNVFMFL